jgi:hypothetical protein
MFAQTISFALIDSVESRAKDLMSQSNSLTMTLTTCINKYQGIAFNKRSLRFAPREVSAKA